MPFLEQRRIVLQVIRVSNSALMFVSVSMDSSNIFKSVGFKNFFGSPEFPTVGGDHRGSPYSLLESHFSVVFPTAALNHLVCTLAPILFKICAILSFLFTIVGANRDHGVMLHIQRSGTERWCGTSNQSIFPVLFLVLKIRAHHLFRQPADYDIPISSPFFTLSPIHIHDSHTRRIGSRLTSRRQIFERNCPNHQTNVQETMCWRNKLNTAL